MRQIDSLKQSDFISKFSIFLFDYFQSRNNLSINETIDIKIKAEISDKNIKKNINEFNCSNILETENIKIIDDRCNIYLNVLNIGEDKKFIWIVRLNKYNESKNLSSKLVTSYLNKKDLITFDFDLSKTSSLLLVFGNEFNKNINKWIFNLIRGKAILNNTLYRIQALGFGFKKLEFKRVIYIDE